MATSEFGKGLTYCIGLFLAHAERDLDFSSVGRWFNGASDHLYELDTSIITDKTLRAEVENWQEKVLKWGHGFLCMNVTKKDKEWAISEGLRLLRRIDEVMLNTEVVQGTWE